MSNSWVLEGARVALGPNEAERLDLEIRSGRIVAIRSRAGLRTGLRRLDLHGCIILPGLINAHDHLEFNLFPRLGHGPYPNAAAWARDIYHPDRSPILEHLRIPLATRMRWGAVKNLLSGVTTVCHHNPYHSHVFSRSFAVRVLRRYGWAHSLHFSPDLAERFRHTPGTWPFVLHLGEAVDGEGEAEIRRLDGLKALDPRTVLVHAVALRKPGFLLARERGASVVWCPSSNIFILGRTLSRAALEARVPIALGTDSALSGIGDLLAEVRFAWKLGKVSRAHLYGMVTNQAAKIMRLRQGEGTVREGGIADLLVIRDMGCAPASTLLKLQTGAMKMVLVRGEVKLVAPELAGQLPVSVYRRMHLLVIAARRRRVVYLALNVPSLFRKVEPILGSVVLAHTKMLRPS